MQFYKPFQLNRTLETRAPSIRPMKTRRQITPTTTNIHQRHHIQTKRPQKSIKQTRSRRQAKSVRKQSQSVKKGEGEGTKREEDVQVNGQQNLATFMMKRTYKCFIKQRYAKMKHQLINSTEQYKLQKIKHEWQNTSLKDKFDLCQKYIRYKYILSEEQSQTSSSSEQEPHSQQPSLSLQPPSPQHLQQKEDAPHIQQQEEAHLQAISPQEKVLAKLQVEMHEQSPQDIEKQQASNSNSLSNLQGSNVQQQTNKRLSVPKEISLFVPSKLSAQVELLIKQQKSHPNIQNRPKKTNAYLKFYQQKFREHQKLFPRWTASEITKVVKTLWKKHKQERPLQGKANKAVYSDQAKQSGQQQLRRAQVDCWQDKKRLQDIKRDRIKWHSIICLGDNDSEGQQMEQCEKQQARSNQEVHIYQQIKKTLTVVMESIQKPSFITQWNLSPTQTKQLWLQQLRNFQNKLQKEGAQEPNRLLLSELLAPITNFQQAPASL